MDNTIIYIKIKTGCTPLNYIHSSLSDNTKRYYNLSEKDRSTIENLSNESHLLVVVEYDSNNIICLYVGVCDCTETSICYQIKKKISSQIVIKNIIKLSELDLWNDFSDGDYICCEKSSFISEQINFIINAIKPSEANEAAYTSYEDDVHLHPLAQRNEYTQRYYNYRKPVSNRCEFQRDYERIVHSKAFRRMVDKAQVFSATKGDYYRTRMTHTQAVVQIARGISSALKLNMYLTEAIALGHDIGHTPFGHQGERTLNDILTGKIPIIKNQELFLDNFGGFKHNYQSLRIATKLEEEYFGIDGLDLSLQTLEGMIKHTKINKDTFSLSEFTEYDSSEILFNFAYKFSTTLEGQVVAVADEIAQRGHDLDDALSSGTITYQELKELLTIKKTAKIDKIIRDTESELHNAKKNHKYFCDEVDVRNKTIVSRIISYFINDVINTSFEAMNNYDLELFKINKHTLHEELITFSSEGSTICKYLEIMVTNKVINSSEIAMFDSNASTIVKGLFRAYYNNPKLLHKGTLRRITIDFRKFTHNTIDLNCGNHEVIKRELSLIVNGDLNNKEIFSAEQQEEYMNKRRILVRNICDYISGMTDTYATREYNKIVK